MIFGSKSLNSFPLSATYSFLKYLLYAYGQAEATLRIYTQVSIASVRPIFWPFVMLVWVATYTLWTTGLRIFAKRDSKVSIIQSILFE